ncbi:MAG TPA: metallophosphoesterase [Bryobacteraceae bacterium]|nr:metallophosphoesterase [Bryobacteraceae bacterium]
MAPLVEAVCDARPDVVVVSGDFVQNGTRPEFEQARAFVEQLPHPLILVPGNHDLPFRNLWRRFRVGLRYYRNYIEPDLEPFLFNGDLALMGVNTARPWLLRGGRIDEGQIRRIEDRLISLDPGVLKILVTHHPFDLAGTYHRRELVGRARMAMGRLAQSVDVMLAGHMHVSHAGHTAVRYKLKGRSAVFVQAGTATSTRGRGEPNAFNLVRIGRPSLVIERHQWQHDDRVFRCICTDRFAIEPEPAVRTAPALEQEPREVEAVYPAAG